MFKLDGRLLICTCWQKKNLNICKSSLSFHERTVPRGLLLTIWLRTCPALVEKRDLKKI
jgi:hypothetical protein